MRARRVLVSSFIILAIVGCGGSRRPVRQRVLLPPTLNLVPHHTVDLSVWLVNTRTGGVMWRRSSSSTEEVGGLSFIGGTPEFSARDPNDAYGHLINQLVYNVTYDVRSTWVDQ